MPLFFFPTSIARLISGLVTWQPKPTWKPVHISTTSGNTSAVHSGSIWQIVCAVFCRSVFVWFVGVCSTVFGKHVFDKVFFLVCGGKATKALRFMFSFSWQRCHRGNECAQLWARGSLADDSIDPWSLSWPRSKPFVPFHIYHWLEVRNLCMGLDA